MPREMEVPAALVGKFDVEDAGSEWHLTCKRCPKRWALKKSSDHPGNVLHLLNHAAGHRLSDGRKLAGGDR